jgi:protein-tyrosine phosphatase
METPMSPDDVTWITERVAITNFFSAHQAEVLAEQQVEAILCLDREVQGNAAIDRGVECISLVHLWDGENEMVIFREAVAALEDLLARHRRVVVHCRAGRSRSVAVVAAYLKMSHGLKAHEALVLVRTKRDSAIAPELIRLVERFEP